MTARTFRARIVCTQPDTGDKDMGEQLVTIRDLIEQGRPVGLHATFDHNGETLSGSVKKIEPPDWETRAGVTPIVLVNSSC
jgi:hypothetical protein